MIGFTAKKGGSDEDKVPTEEHTVVMARPRVALHVKQQEAAVVVATPCEASSQYRRSMASTGKKQQ
jgi:hypothetical protein